MPNPSHDQAGFFFAHRAPGFAQIDKGVSVLE
jgi:hypothetical protein